MAQTSLVPSPFQVTIWRAGISYNPGDVVQPTTVKNTGPSPPTNADFALSLAGWTADAAYTWDGTKNYNSAVGSAKFAASAGTGLTIINTNQATVIAGQVINGYCYIGDGTQAIGGALVSGSCTLTWYDVANAVISTTVGTAIYPVAYIGSPIWLQATVTGTAPSNAVKCSIGAICTNLSALPFWVDAFYWDYLIPSTAVPAYFTNILTVPGTSGGIEPDWTNNGTNTGNVQDNTITWGRGLQSIIKWQPWPFNFSTTIEPIWPVNAGASVSDGFGTATKPFFSWLCQTPQIQDANCPQSKYVVIGSSKIFATDTDICRYSATTNPTDWTTVADAGFLPTGLQNYGANSATAIGLYRSNLVIFNSQGLQMWQIDEDPANMSLLTALPIGCSYQKTVCPVNTDLFFLAAQGVRTMGISAASSNLEAGDVGMPIDSIVQSGTAYCNANNTEPLSTYFPSTGQYWIHFPGWQAAGFFYSTPANTSNVFVYTMSRVGQVGAWSRYNFPFPTIDAFCQLNDNLYIRSGDDILIVDPTALYDYAADTYNGGNRQTTFQGVVQWPWLDLGQPGETKQLLGVDVISSASTTMSIEVGYDQTNKAVFTTPYVPGVGDTVPGMFIPIPCMASSFSPRLVFPSSLDNWQVQAVNAYLKDQRPTA